MGDNKEWILKKQDGRVWAVLLWLQKDKWQALMTMTMNIPHTNW
jgi:hypothetical protein